MQKPLESIKNCCWDRIPTDPRSVSCDRAFFDTQVFEGSVKRGSCWRFLGLNHFIVAYQMFGYTHIYRERKTRIWLDGAFNQLKQPNEYVYTVYSRNSTTCGGSQWILFVYDFSGRSKCCAPSRFTRWFQSFLN